MRRRSWAEAVAAGSVSLLLIVTLWWPAWIELGFGADLDHGNGSAEWGIVALGVVALMGIALARRQWRRAGAASPIGGSA